MMFTYVTLLLYYYCYVGGVVNHVSFACPAHFAPLSIGGGTTGGNGGICLCSLAAMGAMIIMLCTDFWNREPQEPTTTLEWF